MNKPGDAGIAHRDVVRLGPPVVGRARATDEIAVEEPLEIRIAGEAVATTMRTPGHDRELALGFLFAEGILETVADVGSVAHCGRPQDEGHGNVIDVVPGPGVSLDVERVGSSKRGTLTTASCGVCGRRSIDDLLSRIARLEDDVRMTAREIAAMAGELRAGQHNFARTGGLHAAAIFDARATTLALYEDIGRHNALDKSIGALFLANRLPARGSVAYVSGRASFEIVQKAAAAGIPIVASLSAASSLAIDLAKRANITLIGFLRGDTMNVYAGEERIVDDGARPTPPPERARSTRAPSQRRHRG